MKTLEQMKLFAQNSVRISEAFIDGLLDNTFKRTSVGEHYFEYTKEEGRSTHIYFSTQSFGNGEYHVKYNENAHWYFYYVHGYNYVRIFFNENHDILDLYTNDFPLELSEEWLFQQSLIHNEHTIFTIIMQYYFERSNIKVAFLDLNLYELCCEKLGLKYE